MPVSRGLLGLGLACAAAIAAAEERATTWATVEPLVRRALAGEAIDGPAGDAVGAGVERALPRVMLEAAALGEGSDDLAPLLRHPRAGRLLRGAVADALGAAGIACADCRAEPSAARRELAFAELVPYVAAATYVGTDDLRSPLEEPAFHACAGGVLGAKLPDAELGSVALASFLALLDDEQALRRVRSHVARARREAPDGDARAVTDLYRGFLLSDASLGATLRGVAAEEARVAGLRCTDCRANDPEGTWSLRWRRSRWQPAHVDGALTIRSGEAGWTGAGWAETIHGNRFFFDLSPIEIAAAPGGGVRFTARRADAAYHFEGVVSGGTMDGSVRWVNPSGGEERDAFVAVRRDVRRFDDDVPSARFERAAAPGIGGDELDRLILLAEESRSDALVILADGRLACSRRFGAAAQALDLQSVTKAISSLAIPLLIEDGRIASVDQPLSTWLPEMADGGREAITLRHVLTHSSGLDPGTTQELNEAPDRRAHALAAPLAAPPGTQHEYSNRAFQLVSAIVRQASGEEIDDYLGRRLFRPLGLTSPRWSRDRSGEAGSYAGLSIEAEELAAIGQVLADGGRWRGAQLLPASWIAEIPRASGASTRMGLGWFRLGEADAAGFAHTGDGGQALIVMPTARLVVVRLARIPGGPHAPDAPAESAEMDAIVGLASHLAESLRTR